MRVYNFLLSNISILRDKAIPFEYPSLNLESIEERSLVANLFFPYCPKQSMTGQLLMAFFTLAPNHMGHGQQQVSHFKVLPGNSLEDPS